jgi:hypothetical protein
VVSQKQTRTLELLNLPEIGWKITRPVSGGQFQKTHQPLQVINSFIVLTYGLYQKYNYKADIKELSSREKQDRKIINYN